MKLPAFLTKHQIILSRPILAASMAGLKLMSKSKDPHHNDSHIYHILSNLSYLLSSIPGLKQKIKFEILIPAICWHDVWIANHTAHNLFELLLHQAVEGRQSAKMWTNYASRIFNSAYVSQVAYCIRKHSSLQFLPPFNLEAKILIDLDKLEVWNIYRFLGHRQTLVSQREFFTRYLVRLYYLYSWYAGLYFRVLENRLNKLSTLLWTAIK